MKLSQVTKHTSLSKKNWFNGFLLIYTHHCRSFEQGGKKSQMNLDWSFSDRCHCCSDGFASGNFKAMLFNARCYILLAVPERFLWCCTSHCSLGDPLSPGCARAMWGMLALQGWSCLGQMVWVKWHPHKCESVVSMLWLIGVNVEPHHKIYNSHYGDQQYQKYFFSIIINTW